MLLTLALPIAAVAAVPQTITQVRRAPQAARPAASAPVPLFREDATLLPFDPTLFGRGVAAADVTLDGRLDFIIATSGGAVLFVNHGDLGFVDESATRLPAGLNTSFKPILADVDGDGDLDLTLLSADLFLPDVLLLADGAGGFGAPTPLPVTSASAFGVAHASDAEWVDVDGDGDLDLVRSVGESGHAQNAGPASLALNDGAGGLTPRSDFEVATWNDPNVATTGVAFLDVNLDGRQDLFFTRAQPGPGGASNLMLLGAGDGTFVDASASLPVFEDDSFDAIPLDLEGDGDMDLVVANSLIAISGADSGDVLVNQGFAQGGRVGSFLDAPGAIDEAPTFAEALRLGPIAGDVDLDGRIDVMMRVHDLPPGGHQPLFLGRGTQFERAIFPTGTMITAGGAFGDVDGDGDLDLLLTSAGSAAGGTTLGRALLYINQTR